MRVFVNRFIAAVALFALLNIIGVIGYITLEGWRFGDALYMTVITLTAVGYSEVYPLSEAGRIFTMALLGGGVTWLAIWFALITSLIIELDLKNVIRSRHTMKAIENQKDHVIVCGAGRTGRQVLEELAFLGQPWVMIERDPAIVEEFYALYPEGPVVAGDATQDHTLQLAGIDRARGLIACLSADTDNLFVCLSARDLKPSLVIVARAYEEPTMAKLYRAGADHVVSPNVSGAIRMASMMLRPSVVSFLDFATRSTDMALRVEQATVEQNSPMVGKTLQQAQIPQKTGLLVIALRKTINDEEHEFVFNPDADTLLEVGDEMIVLGRLEQVDMLRRYISV